MFRIVLIPLNDVYIFKLHTIKSRRQETEMTTNRYTEHTMGTRMLYRCTYVDKHKERVSKTQQKKPYPNGSEEVGLSKYIREKLLSWYNCLLLELHFASMKTYSLERIRSRQTQEHNQTCVSFRASTRVNRKNRNLSSLFFVFIVSIIYKWI